MTSLLSVQSFTVLRKKRLGNFWHPLRVFAALKTFKAHSLAMPIIRPRHVLSFSSEDVVRSIFRLYCNK